MRHRLSSMAAAAIVGVALGGCAIRNPDQSGSQTRMYGRPKNGYLLCLASKPGVPVYLGPGENGNGSPLIGYTQNMIAFWGDQFGHYIRVMYYTGALGWMDGTEIRPYGSAHPGHTCTIPGRDIQQRPQFVIR